jgi:parallel beta-helix repeat protein
VGAYLHSITGGSVTGNNISENTGIGLAIYYSSNNIIENNTIQGNLKGGGLSLLFFEQQPDLQQLLQQHEQRHNL